jgi:hypothetical protein
MAVIVRPAEALGLEAATSGCFAAAQPAEIAAWRFRSRSGCMKLIATRIAGHALHSVENPS